MMLLLNAMRLFYGIFVSRDKGWMSHAFGGVAAIQTSQQRSDSQKSLSQPDKATNYLYFVLKAHSRDLCRYKDTVL